MTIAALKFLQVQKMDSMVIIYSYRVKMKKFIAMKVLLSYKSNKTEINIYDEIYHIIQYCKKQDFHNPVEILKYLQENLIQGRPLEIADASQCIDGETNFIMVDRSNLLKLLQKKFSICKINF